MDAGEVSDKLVPKMRDINDDLLNPIGLELLEGVFDHRFARDRKQRLGLSEGKRIKSRRIPCSED